MSEVQKRQSEVETGSKAKPVCHDNQAILPYNLLQCKTMFFLQLLRQIANGY